MSNWKVWLGAILIGFFYSHFGQAQSSKALAEDYYKRGEVLFDLDDASEETYDVAVRYYQKAIELLEEEGVQNITLAQCHQRIGSIYLDRDALDKALAEYHQSLSIKSNLPTLNDSLLYSDYVFLGNIHFYLDRYDSASYYYDKAEKVAINEDEQLADIERIYNSLGVFNLSLGNYQKAITYHDKALSLMPQEGFDYVIAKVSFTYNTAIALTKLGRYQEAIRRYKEILKYNVYQSWLYQGLGNSYLGIAEYDSALYYLKKTQNENQFPLNMLTHNSMGNLFYQTNQLDSAKAHFQRTVQINVNDKRGKNTNVTRAYPGLGDVAVAQGNPQVALQSYQQALISTTFDFDDHDVTSNPSEKNEAISLLQRFQVLQQKGKAFEAYYQQNQDTTNLLHALNCFQEAIEVARHTQKTYDNEEAKLFFVNKVHSVYDYAIHTAYQLYQHTKKPQYVDLALQFSEKSKASVLTEILRDVDIKASGKVNDSLINEEKLIKQQITANRLKLVESSDSTQNEMYRQKLNDLEIALARVIKQLQRDERYYQLKYQDDTLDLAAWQAQLVSSEDVLLEYFMGENNMYIFSLTQDSLAMQEVALDSTFTNTWHTVQQHLFTYEYGDEYQKRWSNELYQKLITPVGEQLLGKRRLIIIPAGELSYLPFEILTSPEHPEQYLLHDYAIDYAFSGVLLNDAHHRRGRKHNQNVLAMAPFAGPNVRALRNNGLSPLYFSRQEVSSLGGSLYLEEKATKQLFLKIAGSYNILHLATHASVDDENPLQSFIAFYPEDESSLSGYRLYTHELYNMRLDSVNLVVLSSCEAGNGRLVKGEGIISLARAFAYAGCPNIVTTLWKADDKAAADITSQMHRYLKKGYDKDEALRQAKLSYLQDPETRDLRDPYYWANFVFIGDPVPMYDNYHWVWWLAVGTIVALSLGLILWGRRKPMDKQLA